LNLSTDPLKARPNFASGVRVHGKQYTPPGYNSRSNGPVKGGTFLSDPNYIGLQIG
jgi:hypothetical protein